MLFGGDYRCNSALSTDLMKLSGRETPLQAREPGVIAIEGDPFAAGLDGQCGKPCIRRQVTAGVSFNAKTFENVPVPLARLNDHAVGLRKEYVAETENFIQAAGHRKNLRVGGDADHTRCHQTAARPFRPPTPSTIRPCPARVGRLNKTCLQREYFGGIALQIQSEMIQ